MADKIYKSPLDQAKADFEAGKISQGQLDDVAIAEKQRDWNYPREKLPKDWDNYSTDNRLTFYERVFPNDDNPKFKAAILQEYKERMAQIMKDFGIDPVTGKKVK